LERGREKWARARVGKVREDMGWEGMEGNPLFSALLGLSESYICHYT